MQRTKYLGLSVKIYTSTQENRTYTYFISSVHPQVKVLHFFSHSAVQKNPANSNSVNSYLRLTRTRSNFPSV